MRWVINHPHEAHLVNDFFLVCIMQRGDLLVYGVGINDADYSIFNGDTWKACPYYSKWVSMLQRCFSECFKIKQPAYINATCVGDWLYFSNFKEWMIEQDWQYNELDKDILYPGNMIYGPTTCCFVPGRVNLFFVSKSPGKTGLTGVYERFHTSTKGKSTTIKYIAAGRLRSGGKGKKHLGYYNNKYIAYGAYLIDKISMMNELKDGCYGELSGFIKEGINRHIKICQSQLILC